MITGDLKVLICDDSILARKKMIDSLTACGCHQLMEASDGQSAVEMYKSEKPHITFLDIIMPIKDGVTALKEIIEYDKNAYIIMVSSIGTQSYLQESIKAGAHDFLQKPIEIAQVQQIIDHILGVLE